jgi:SAM-dependent methyltransferase
MTLDEWNERYRKGEELDREPATLLVEATSSLSPGRALDLACGAGRNAVWLAERGWSVVALDGAAEAIKRVPAPIDARVFDLEQGRPLPFPDESFDLVLVLFYLHRPLFAEARRVLRSGGTLVTSALTRGRFGVAPGELRSFFDDWEVRIDRAEEVAELVAVRP